MKKYFILAAVAATFAACSFDKDLGESSSQTITQEERVPLSIGAVYNANNPNSTTRSTTNNLQDNAIVASATSGVNMGIFIFKKNSFNVSSPTAEDYEKFNLTSSGLTVNGTTNTTDITTTNTLYYPGDKTQNLDIYAYAPYDDTYTTGPINTQTLTVSVKTDQSTDANYYASDILWGCVGDGTNSGNVTATGNNSNASINAANYKTAKENTANHNPQAGYTTGSTPSVIIPMFHKGAKIKVKLTPNGMPITKLQGATVQFYVNGSDTSTPSTTTLKLSDGTITSITSGATLAPITLTSKLGYKPDGTTLLTTSDANANGDNGVINDSETPAKMKTYVCSGIILPQALAAGNDLIKITLASSEGSTVYLYKIPTTGSPVTSFVAGKVYTYDIAVKVDGLTLTTTVADWDPQTGDTGDATLQ